MVKVCMFITSIKSIVGFWEVFVSLCNRQVSADANKFQRDFEMKNLIVFAIPYHPHIRFKALSINSKV